jgi:predicted  nucleic acid-binding Zn-ribbon protein
VLKDLLALQRLDLKIENFKARELEIPKQKNKYKITRDRLDAELKASDQKVKDLQIEQRACEGDIQQKQQNILKYENQLLAVKKNEEYQALLHEIDIVKKQIGVKEERILSIMLEIDTAKTGLEEDKKRIAVELKAIDTECATIDAELAETVKEREALEAQRAPLAKQIDPAMLSRYDRIRKAKRTGAALVIMRNDSCSGCNMRILPQVVNELLAGNKIHSCPHCGRLLYHLSGHDEEAAEIVA